MAIIDGVSFLWEKKSVGFLFRVVVAQGASYGFRVAFELPCNFGVGQAGEFELSRLDHLLQRDRQRMTAPFRRDRGWRFPEPPRRRAGRSRTRAVPRRCARGSGDSSAPGGRRRREDLRPGLPGDPRAARDGTPARAPWRNPGARPRPARPGSSPGYRSRLRLRRA